ncbi:MAG: hypothetical protein ACK4RZ_16905 [Paracoccaceae bacterium]
MTRVLVLGNSHAATLRRAFPALAADNPTLDLTFWGLPGAAFDKARTDADGVLRPDPTDRVSLRKVDQWNDCTHADLSAHDRIFLVGLRFNLRPVLTLFGALQPLQWGRRDGALGVSDSFLRAAIRAAVDATLAALTARIQLDDRCVLMPAPYPAACVTQHERGHFEPVTTTASSLPHASEMMDVFETAITSASAARGLGLLLQPRETLERPFLTQDRFLDDSARDARHMNDDYGHIALRALLAFSAMKEATASRARLTHA